VFFLQNSKILVRQQLFASIKTKQNTTDNIFFLPSPWWLYKVIWSSRRVRWWNNEESSLVMKICSSNTRSTKKHCSKSKNCLIVYSLYWYSGDWVYDKNKIWLCRAIQEDSLHALELTSVLKSCNSGIITCSYIFLLFNKLYHCPNMVMIISISAILGNRYPALYVILYAATS